MRFALKACTVWGVLWACCLLLSSCGAYSGFTRAIPAHTGPRGVEFVGVYEDRSELIPGLRSAISVEDLAELLQESNKPGGTNIRAQFRVVNVLSPGGCIEPGDRLYLIFRSPKGPRDPSPLPDRFVGRTLRIRLHDRFSTRYCGRFTYAEWRGVDGAVREGILVARRSR
ncbi:MAG: hypothetical protein JW889_09265 [Verrucomicrobia bacterium]|nr:hypothetical protein [Verrucomicrobiota bacterium]